MIKKINLIIISLILISSIKAEIENYFSFSKTFQNYFDENIPKTQDAKCLAYINEEVVRGLDMFLKEKNIENINLIFLLKNPSEFRVYLANDEQIYYFKLMPTKLSIVCDGRLKKYYKNDIVSIYDYKSMKHNEYTLLSMMPLREKPIILINENNINGLLYIDAPINLFIRRNLNNRFIVEYARYGGFKINHPKDFGKVVHSFDSDKSKEEKN